MLAPVPRGRTALFIAAAENHPDLLRMLLDAKANVHSANRWGLCLRELVAWWGLLQFLEVKNHKKENEDKLIVLLFVSSLPHQQMQ